VQYIEWRMSQNECVHYIHQELYASKTIGVLSFATMTMKLIILIGVGPLLLVDSISHGEVVCST